MSKISDIRKDYTLQVLQETDVNPDPMKQFDKWWEEAVQSQIDEVNAMTLATANKEGRPGARIVLLKGVEPDGFVFFTNYNSNKGKDIAENPFATLLFFWKELERQVKIEGSISKVSEADSDAYFYSRPEGSRLGAWASPQSTAIASREVIERNITELQKRFEGKAIDRPPHWGGYIVKPTLIEFWQGRSNRLHDRIQYSLNEKREWQIERLAP